MNVSTAGRGAAHIKVRTRSRDAPLITNLAAVLCPLLAPSAAD
jgi:hypothetical protein